MPQRRHSGRQRPRHVDKDALAAKINELAASDAVQLFAAVGAWIWENALRESPGLHRQFCDADKK